jgi:putative phage-type endonuclease
VECVEGEIPEGREAVNGLTILDVEQRSDEWVKARLGRLTSCRAADMLAVTQPKPTKSGKPSKAQPVELAPRRNLRVQLAIERITGRSQERGFFTAAVRHGIETEGAAVAAYEVLTGRVLYPTGFVFRNDLPWVGASLDGHVGGDEFVGTVEIKCPLSATHWEYLRTNKVPAEYLKQIMHALWVTGAEWCDFLSYDDAFPEPLRAKLVRVTRSDVDIPQYEKKATAFLEEVANEVDAVNTLANLGSQLKEAVA